MPLPMTYLGWTARVTQEHVHSVLNSLGLFFWKAGHTLGSLCMLCVNHSHSLWLIFRSWPARAGQQRETEGYVGGFLLGVHLYFSLTHPFLNTQRDGIHCHRSQGSMQVWVLPWALLLWVLILVRQLYQLWTKPILNTFCSLCLKIKKASHLRRGLSSTSSDLLFILRESDLFKMPMRSWQPSVLSLKFFILKI